MVLKLTSPAFTEGQPIPRRFSCAGEDVSPPLEWTVEGPPPAGYALVVRDPDARGFVHWAVSGIPAEWSGLPEGAGEPGHGPLAQGRNDFGRSGWGGPCPPSGTHRYRFTLFALKAPLGSGPHSAEDIERADSLARDTLVGTYQR